MQEQLSQDNLPIEIYVEGQEKPNLFVLPRITALSFAEYLFEEKRMFDDAINFCQAFIKADPKDAYIYYTMGKAHEALGKIDMAIEAYKKSIVISSQPMPYFRLWGIYVYDKDDTAKAEENLNIFNNILSESTKMSPSYVKRNLIKELAETGNYFLNESREFDKAIKYFRMVLKLNPDDERVQLNLNLSQLNKCIVLKDRRLFDQVINDLQIIAENTKDPDVALFARQVINERCKEIKKQIFGE